MAFSIIRFFGTKTGKIVIVRPSAKLLIFGGGTIEINAWVGDNVNFILLMKLRLVRIL